MSRAEIHSQAIIADGVFRPLFMGERDAWICQRYRHDDQGRLLVEVHGARMGLTNESRFSPLYLFREADAQAQCDMLNGGNDG